jgi:hypothetical protein
VAVQADGRIVVVGVTAGTEEEFAVVRITANGALDQGFGIGGGVRTAFPEDADATGVAINNHTHKIEVVGVEVATSPSIHVDAMLAARYLAG